MKRKILFLTVSAIAISLVSGFAADADAKPKKPGAGKPRDPKAMAARLVEKADTDKSGDLSKEEFAATPMGKKASEKGGAEAVDKFFGRWDGNSDGKATADEIAAAMSKRGEKGDKPAGKKPGAAKKKPAKDGDDS